METKPGERTAKFVHAGTHLHYGSDAHGWTVHVAVDMPYEECGEFWVDAQDANGDVYPMPLYNAQLGI